MEMLMLSGLKAQSEINWLLDEIYGDPGRVSLSETKRCSKTPEINRRPEKSTGVLKDHALYSSPRSVEIVKQHSGRKVRPLRHRREGRDEGRENVSTRHLKGSGLDTGGPDYNLCGFANRHPGFGLRDQLEGQEGRSSRSDPLASPPFAVVLCAAATQSRVCSSSPVVVGFHHIRMFLTALLASS